MNPKEKAEQLVIQMYQLLPASKEAEKGKEHLYYNQFNAAKQCALILVNEILENFGTLTEGKQHYAAYSTIQFYEKVKQEIENIGGAK